MSIESDNIGKARQFLNLVEADEVFNAGIFGTPEDDHEWDTVVCLFSSVGEDGQEKFSVSLDSSQDSPATRILNKSYEQPQGQDWDEAEPEEALESIDRLTALGLPSIVFVADVGNTGNETGVVNYARGIGTDVAWQSVITALHEIIKTRGRN